MQPIEKLSPAELVARLPVAAQRDLLEWSSTNNASAYLDEVIANEIPLETFLNLDSTVKVTDDQPYNEYFLLRRMGLL